MSLHNTATTSIKGRSASTNVERAVERLREAGLSRARQAFVARALRAVTDIAEKTDEDALVEATAAPSDYDVLLQVLSQPGVRAELQDPLALAKLRGLARREHLLAAEGGVLTVEDVAGLLRITRQAVEKRRRAGTLIGLATGRRGYAYPAWQFDARTGVLAGLVDVLKALGDHDPWMQAIFMLDSNDRLGGDRPLDAVRAGRIAEVVDAAALLGEHGAV
ncbi:MAG TPA: hypothetical protein PKA95_05180 [Thermomicrobiales bacterium]|nr:hypothetical protein [Thermomicrobiales bacterium]